MTKDIRITGWEDLTGEELVMLFKAAKVWEEEDKVGRYDDGMCDGRDCGECPAGKLNTVGFEKEFMLCNIVRGVNDHDYVDPEIYSMSESEDNFQISISDALELIEHEISKRMPSHICGKV